jgi:hypothetical protein
VVRATLAAVRTLLCASLLLATLVGSACNRNVEPYVEGEQAQAPDLSQIFPDESARDVPGQPEAQRGGAPPAAMPTSPRLAVAQASGGGEPISGTISLAAGIEARPSSILFVIARPKGVSAGPPLAVLRLPGPSFPLEFQIGPQNVMIPGMQFQGEIALSARLDSDGNAMTRAPGDPRGESEGAHAPGATGVSIVLDVPR